LDEGFDRPIVDDWSTLITVIGLSRYRRSVEGRVMTVVFSDSSPQSGR